MRFAVDFYRSFYFLLPTKNFLFVCIYFRLVFYSAHNFPKVRRTVVFQMNPQGKAIIPAQEAAAFLKRSNLNVNQLGQVRRLFFVFSPVFFRLLKVYLFSVEQIIVYSRKGSVHVYILFNKLFTIYSRNMCFCFCCLEDYRIFLVFLHPTRTIRRFSKKFLYFFKVGEIGKQSIVVIVSSYFWISFWNRLLCKFLQ